MENGSVSHSWQLSSVAELLIPVCSLDQRNVSRDSSLATEENQKFELHSPPYGNE